MIVVIDVGTSSMRSIGYRLNGKKEFTFQKEYRVIYGQDGCAQQQPEILLETLYTLLRKVKAYADAVHLDIFCISVTAQRSSIAPVDDTGRALAAFIMWQDTRNQAVCEKLKTYNELIFKKTGARINTVFSGGKMRWIREHQPEIYQRAYKLVNIAEYLMFHMTGEFATDVTYAGRSNLMNLYTRQWDSELLELFWIDREKLCQVLEPGSVVGKTHSRLTDHTGLREGIPVISAGGDQQCAAVGLGIFSEGNISVVTGTGAFLMADCSSVPKQLCSDVICSAASVRGRYILEASIPSCCSAFNWFREKILDNSYSLDQLQKDLEEIYETQNDCLVLPHFQGRGTPDWNSTAKAHFLNISLATTRTEIIRALLTGIFYEVKVNIEQFRRYVPVNAGHISGGLTKMTVLNQIQADIYGIPLYCDHDQEASAKGAAMVSMVELGLLKSYKEAYHILGHGDSFCYMPNKDHRFYHEERIKVWEKLYNDLKYSG